MDPFQPQQPDEGYSEDPLTGPAASAFPLKTVGHDDGASLLRSHFTGELSPLLTRHISSLSLRAKTQLTESLLDGLPTSVIAQIVQKLNPRLYIDFIRYLPAEICLKILGYLDPLSLISVAMSCRAWYDLALDRKLWERLYYQEGWRALTAEMQACEEKINRDKPVPSEGGHVFKKRAISSSLRVGGDLDYTMPDADRAPKSEAIETSAQPMTSLFGNPAVVPDNSTPDWQQAASSDAKKKGKERAVSPSPPTPPATTTPSMSQQMAALLSANRLPKSSLWMWDPVANRYRISWKYLYSLRRRLETNWELGKFTNFQFPHPDYPHEAHGECIYTLQFNSEYLVSGSRDRTIRIWNIRTRRLVRQPLAGHRGSVLCLQFDSDPEEDLIVSGSSDSNVILWRFSTGEIIQRLARAHREPVLNVKFDKHILVTCSKDKTIKIFNRKELKPGDLGYGDVLVNPVPVHLKDYGYTGLDQLPLKPPYSLIGSLEGHSAAVNAVQIHGREVVSASGDRNVKIWDWPNQTCVRTFLGHNKGIACVQYDGRRIVSGSSDNEVKVFDRQSGVEVASLRSHSNLVRTVQAGFGDLPYSAVEDEKEAAKVDRRYFEAVQNGTLPTAPQHRRHAGNAANVGSQRPEDILFTGAKLPPGGGGGKYGRIVSGSYDTTIIIWRRDKEGIWKAQHHLKQEEAASAAAATGSLAIARRTHVASRAANRIAAANIPSAAAMPGQQISHPGYPMQVDPPEIRNGASNFDQIALTDFIDNLVGQGVHALQEALATYPNLLTMQDTLHAAIDRYPSPFVRSHLRQSVNTAAIRVQIAQARGARTAANSGPTHTTATGPSAAGFPQAAGGSSANVGRESIVASNAFGVVPPFANPAASSSSATQDGATYGLPSTTQDQSVLPAVAGPVGTHVTTHASVSHVPNAAQNHAQQPSAAAVTGAPPPVAAAATAAGPRPAAHHPHIDDSEAANPARVFKLQFDARRIVCCSQTTTIVGWDFCNGDAELEEAVRFFGTVD